jgi:hypothetical protein
MMFPLWTILLNEILSALTMQEYDRAKNIGKFYLVVAVAILLIIPVFAAPWTILAEKSNVRYRKATLRALLN